VPYRLLPDEPPTAGLRRITTEQSERALERLRSPSDPVEAVHDVRKRCKKLRGLARLVRPGIGARYEEANRAFRDAARELAPIRDRQATAATFRDLADAHPGVRGPAVEEVGEELDERAAAAGDLADGDPRLVRAADLIRDGRDVLLEAEVDGEGPLIAGAGKTYGRARRRLADARASCHDPDAFHEWRKRVKYGWYHLRLLRRLAPALMRPLACAWHDCADALGDAHDLHVVGSMLRADPEAFGSPSGVAAVDRLLTGVRTDLERRALALGASLLVADTDAYEGRLGALWSVRERSGAERPAGAIADLWSDRS
jgi:CHAD domain-containing protein